MLFILPESCLSVWHFLRLRHGGERRVTGEIFRDSIGFGVSYRFVGTARPRVETKLLLCAYTVLQSVSSLPCIQSLINAAFD